MAGAAYRAGQTLYDDRTGETHSYADRDDVKLTRLNAYMIHQGLEKDWFYR